MGLGKRQIGKKTVNVTKITSLNIPFEVEALAEFEFEDVAGSGETFEA